MTGRTLSGYRHDLQITERRSSWPLVIAGALVVALAKWVLP